MSEYSQGIINELRRQYKLRNATWPCLLLKDLMPLCDEFEQLEARATRAEAIADPQAKIDIECHCLLRHHDGIHYYDISNPHPDDTEWVTAAVTYLDARGLLIRHPEHPHLVRWEGE